MNRTSRKILRLLVLPLFFAGLRPAFLCAQAEPPPDSAAVETPAPPPAESESAAADTPPPVPALTPEQKRIDLEIKTSSLTELAVWCRSLGLSEGGSREELARRLREHFSVAEAPAAEGDDKRKIITIESARSTEYFKLEAVDEEYARLTGDVQVSLKDGEAIHRIKAWEILFNRTRNIITANGGVEYLKEEGERVETFKGDSITVNIDNWSSVFLGGTTEHSLQSDGTTYRFEGTVISRNDEDVTVLNHATISNAKNDESLWSLSASRVWLLPGSDFAIFNAVLKVGEIPVMYIPFFYFPADEVVFHPVIGTRTKEGSFVQTTTYVLGRPKASSSSQSSLTRILGNSADMEKVREGLFLRSTGKKAVDSGGPSLRVLLDHYANLGTYLGADFTLPAFSIFGASDFSAGFGFTRTIVQTGSNYSPFAPNYDGTSDWNKANLFSFEVPFRYRFKMSSSISGKFGSFSWNTPFYSDPWVDRDFITYRAEEMDWINMIQKGAALEAEETSDGSLGSYQWALAGNLNLNFPDMKPFINTISINTISSTLSFQTITKNLSGVPAYDPKRFSPERSFFAPYSVTLYSVSGSISGTPLSFGQNTASRSAANNDNTEQPENPLADIGAPRPPWGIAESETQQAQANTDKLSPPVLSQRFDLPRTGNIQFGFDYRFAPNTASELRFTSSKWKEYNDINWGDVSYILSTFGGDASTGLNLNHTDGLFTNSFTFSGNGSWRQYSYINEEADEYLDTSGNPDPAKVREAKKQLYSQSFFSTSYGLTSSLRPLYRNSIFGSSNVQYSIRGLAVKSVFDKNSTGDDPKWDFEYGEWSKEKIDSHQFSANIAASIMDKSQNLSISAELPPRDSAISSSGTFRVWISETNARIRVQYPGEEDKRKIEPFYLTETLRFGNFGSFTHYMVLDTEINEFTTITSTLALSKINLNAVYTAARIRRYELDQSLGWIQNQTEEPSLRSKDFSLSYSPAFNKTGLWDNRLNFSLNISSRLFFDLQRYTSSSFTFSFGINVGISKFLDLRLSANTENAVIFRYFKDWSIFSDLPAIVREGEGEQYNLFTDLLNSFRFDDEARRKSSGFKLKSFSLSATHYMGDWNATLNITMSPYLPSNTRQYQFNSEMSFLVQWIPVSEIKSEMSYSKRNDTWTVK